MCSHCQIFFWGRGVWWSKICGTVVQKFFAFHLENKISWVARGSKSGVCYYCRRVVQEIGAHGGECLSGGSCNDPFFFHASSPGKLARSIPRPTTTRRCGALCTPRPTSARSTQVLDISSKSAGIRLRKKRVFGGGDGGSSAESHNGDTSVDLERALAEYLKSHTDDAETKERKLKIKENESRAAVLQAETFREIAIGSPSARKRKLEVDLMEAETRKLQAQNAKIQLDNQKKQLENQAEQAEQTNKLHHGFLAALERMSSSS